MGKPYKTELQQLHHTYKWALDASIDKLTAFISKSSFFPLIATGSGGSLTAAYMAALLHENTGMVSKSVTPLELTNSTKSIKQACVLAFSAGGNNADIISAFKFAAENEVRHLLACCMRSQSRLRLLADKYSYSSCFDLDLPSGKDGFLATNSLIGFVTLLIRAYGNLYPHIGTLSHDLILTQDKYDYIGLKAKPIVNKTTWVTLYGKWGLPSAFDLESKCTEAALCNVQLADYRNFAHGRHHWLAKRSDESGVVALITPDDVNIAEKTLNLLPHNVPILTLQTEEKGPVGSLELLVKVLNLVYIRSIAQGIDPGRPGVPQFGRKIYNMRFSLKNNKKALGINSQLESIILRKSNCPSLLDMTNESLNYWKQAYEAFMYKLTNTSFGSVVFDYDGTLCDFDERYTGPKPEVGYQLVQILEKGLCIGVATGRGKSVRIDLQELIPEKYWEQVIIGYHNGSDIAPLSSDKHPNKNDFQCAQIESINNTLNKNWELNSIAKIECRPRQVSIEPVVATKWKRVKEIVIETIARISVGEVQVLESSHSLDVVSSGVSKLHLVKACEEHARGVGMSDAVLCIGDKGKWPGNDYELLSNPYSLSVDTVSSEPMSCWNLSKPGHRGVQATLYYLQSLDFIDDKQLTFSLRRKRN